MTTRISDEVLMAYADGELDGAAREDVQRALALDPALARRVERQAALRERVQAAYRPLLAEPLPERLLRAAQRAPAAESPGVVDLAGARAARSARRGWTWAHWGGMAASVLLGLVLGRLVPFGADAAPFETLDGRLVARGALARALSQQPAGVTGGQVALQLTFVDATGVYCRTFTSAELAGLACRDGARWTLQVLARAEPTAAAGLRQAAAALPAAVLDAVDQRIDGAALDAPAERAAIDRGWTR
jgi:hypothetical protein